jgi:hypothetical protein
MHSGELAAQTERREEVTVCWHTLQHKLLHMLQQGVNLHLMLNTHGCLGLLLLHHEHHPTPDWDLTGTCCCCCCTCAAGALATQQAHAQCKDVNRSLTTGHVAALSVQRPALLGVARPAYFPRHERARNEGAERLTPDTGFVKRCAVAPINRSAGSAYSAVDSPHQEHHDRQSCPAPCTHANFDTDLWLAAGPAQACCLDATASTTDSSHGPRTLSARQSDLSMSHSVQGCLQNTGDAVCAS